MSKPIHFEFQQFRDVTIVALDAKLSDFDFQITTENGQVVKKCPSKTIKDCRNIDGCVYLHLGHVSDNVMIDLIEKFQKLKLEKGWKPNPGLIVPDHKFKFD